MGYQPSRLVGLAALVASIAGSVAIARAELIEPAAPADPPSVIKAFRPVPLPASRPGASPTVFRRLARARTVVAALPQHPQAHCVGWFECGGQYLVVGIGF
jgi:hypothetical protein